MIEPGWGVPGPVVSRSRAKGNPISHYKRLIAGLGLTVVGLVGCSSTSEPAPVKSGSSASTVEATSPAAAAPSKALEDMVLSGEVAGVTFSKAPDSAQNEAADGLAKALEGVKIEPQACKKVVTTSVLNASQQTGQVAIAQQGAAIYSAGVLSSAPSLKRARADAEKCQTFTMDLGVQGVTATGSIAISDFALEGVSDGYTSVTTVSVGGEQNVSISVVGQVGDTVASVSGLGDATQKKVEEIFAAQAEKVTS